MVRLMADSVNAIDFMAVCPKLIAETIGRIALRFQCRQQRLAPPSSKKAPPERGEFGWELHDTSSATPTWR
jgi:hypothetical protein